MSEATKVSEPATLNAQERELANVLIDVQRGKIGIITGVYRIQQLQAGAP